MIKNKEYLLRDQLCQLVIADSFSANKMGTGHGEAKLYLGQEKSTMDFWDDNSKCYFFKKDFVDYLHKAKSEFMDPSQVYQKDTSVKWKKLNQRISQLKDDELEFIAERTNTNPPRFYINSDDDLWDLFRDMVLPEITFLTIFKLKNEETGELIFYFQPILNHLYDGIRGTKKEFSIVEEIKQDPDITKTEKIQLTQARIGQGRFRSDLLNEWNKCMITTINEPAILIASHIKPWAQSNNQERLDHYNGLVLSPTFDKLFDQGFITFRRAGDDVGVCISDHVGKRTKELLNIKENQIFKIPNVSKRLDYLKHHRDHIFRT